MKTHHVKSLGTQSGGYYVKNKNLTYARQLSEAYSFWHSQRHTLFHYGDIYGTIDTTRELKTKEEANEIIHQALMVYKNAW